MKHLLVLVFLLVGLTVSAQEYEVVSFDVKPKDMTARTNSRIDANGRKCAVVKVYVDDKIATVRGSVVGEIESIGMEKQIYMAHDAKEMELIFENHYPITISFIDYDFPSLTGQMTYILKLQSKANNLQASHWETKQNQTSNQGGNSVATSTAPQKEDNTAEIEELREKAKSEFSNHNYVRAFEIFKTIPDDKESQFYLGFMFDEGLGVVQNYSEAMKWYRKAAEQGDASAQCLIGIIYNEGHGVTQDYSEAVKWFRKAANQGNATAQYCLGAKYYFGNGVSKEYSEAMKWYRKAADQGYASAQYNLGNMYYDGKGVIQDYSEALKWYRKAADQGDASAQYNLGFMYHVGQGVSQNYSEAEKWYQKAAGQGNAGAQYNLGVIYYYGYGVQKDLEKAKEFWTLAAKQGHLSSRDSLRKYFKLSIPSV